MAENQDATDYEVTDVEEATEIKRRTAPSRVAGTWRADLWGNVPQAVNWANTIPVEQPGEIIFNVRDNGQVWTFTFGDW